MAQLLFVLVFHSRFFPAQWSFWLPDRDAAGNELDTGHRLHVTGDRRSGFQYECLPNYNIKEDASNPGAHPIGLLPADAAETESKNIVEALDHACREVPAPGPSLQRPEPGEMARGMGPPRGTVKDCQWWIKQAVAHLMEQGLLVPMEDGNVDSPQAKVEALPRN